MVIDKLLKIEHNYNIDFKIFLLGKKIFSHGYYRKQSGRLTIDEISRRLEQYLYVLSNVNTENKKDENSKYVWQMWLQGFEQAPEIVKMCHKSCLHHLDKEIIMIDINNVSDYIEVPDYILDKYTRGVIIPAHFSDYLRCCLLYKYGGFWIDSTIYMTDNMPDYILDSDFFAFSRPPVSMGGGMFAILRITLFIIVKILIVH